MNVDQHVLDRYQVLREVGKGAYGTVWKVRHHQSGEIFALKKIERAFINTSDARRTLREISVLRVLRGCKFFTQLYEVLKADNDMDIYLVLNYMNADLHTLARNTTLSLNQLINIASQLFEAVHIIHSLGLIHRDMKPANILINRDGKIQVGDFGLCRPIPSNIHNVKCTPLTDYVATRWYRSPEMLIGTRSDPRPSDIWGIGCILAELMLGGPLFQGRTRLELIARMIEIMGAPDDDELIGMLPREILNTRRRSFEAMFSAKYQPIITLLRCIFVWNPNSRIKAGEALKLQMFKNFIPSAAPTVMKSRLYIPAEVCADLSPEMLRDRCYEEVNRYHLVYDPFDNILIAEATEHKEFWMESVPQEAYQDSDTEEYSPFSVNGLRHVESRHGAGRSPIPKQRVPLDLNIVENCHLLGPSHTKLDIIHIHETNPAAYLAIAARFNAVYKHYLWHHMRCHDQGEFLSIDSFLMMPCASKKKACSYNYSDSAHRCISRVDTIRGPESPQPALLETSHNRTRGSRHYTVVPPRRLNTCGQESLIGGEAPNHMNFQMVDPAYSTPEAIPCYFNDIPHPTDTFDGNTDSILPDYRGSDNDRLAGIINHNCGSNSINWASQYTPHDIATYMDNILPNLARREDGESPCSDRNQYGDFRRRERSSPMLMSYEQKKSPYMNRHNRQAGQLQHNDRATGSYAHSQTSQGCSYGNYRISNPRSSRLSRLPRMKETLLRMKNTHEDGFSEYIAAPINNLDHIRRVERELSAKLVRKLEKESTDIQLLSQTFADAGYPNFNTL